FSSRGRHTRSKRDWSSDVCSSDLTIHQAVLGNICYGLIEPVGLGHIGVTSLDGGLLSGGLLHRSGLLALGRGRLVGGRIFSRSRSEERRVGKEAESEGGAGARRAH